MANDFDQFIECLRKAGRRIDRHYFELDVAGSEKSIYRERVYCYELYQQLRCAMGDSFGYKLDGEVDKASHPSISPTLGAKKPDFIVHMPGEMNGNLVIIEVKPVTVKSRMNELTEDLKTLKGFLNKASYHRAIMLIYGDGKSDLPNEIPDELKKCPEARKGRILLVWHRGPGKEPVTIKIQDSYVA